MCDAGVDQHDTLCCSNLVHVFIMVQWVGYGPFMQLRYLANHSDV